MCVEFRCVHCLIKRNTDKLAKKIELLRKIVPSRTKILVGRDRVAGQVQTPVVARLRLVSHWNRLRTTFGFSNDYRRYVSRRSRIRTALVARLRAFRSVQLGFSRETARFFAEKISYLHRPSDSAARRRNGTRFSDQSRKFAYVIQT